MLCIRRDSLSIHTQHAILESPARGLTMSAPSFLMVCSSSVGESTGDLEERCHIRCCRAVSQNGARKEYDESLEGSTNDAFLQSLSLWVTARRMERKHCTRYLNI